MVSWKVQLRSFLILAAAIVVATICSAALAEGKQQGEGEKRGKGKDQAEQIIKFDEAPAAVKTTLVKEAQGATITELRVRMREDKKVYGSDVTIGGVTYKIMVAEDGKLLSKRPYQEGSGDQKHEK